MKSERPWPRSHLSSRSSAKAEAKTQAEKTFAEMRAQQQVFQEMLKKQTADGTVNWTHLMYGLETNWTSFESRAKIHERNLERRSAFTGDVCSAG